MRYFRIKFGEMLHNRTLENVDKLASELQRQLEAGGAGGVPVNGHVALQVFRNRLKQL